MTCDPDVKIDTPYTVANVNTTCVERPAGYVRLARRLNGETVLQQKVIVHKDFQVIDQYWEDTPTVLLEE